MNYIQKLELELENKQRRLEEIKEEKAELKNDTSSTIVELKGIKEALNRLQNAAGCEETDTCVKDYSSMNKIKYFLSEFGYYIDRALFWSSLVPVALISASLIYTILSGNIVVNTEMLINELPELALVFSSLAFGWSEIIFIITKDKGTFELLSSYVMDKVSAKKIELEKSRQEKNNNTILNEFGVDTDYFFNSIEELEKIIADRGDKLQRLNEEEQALYNYLSVVKDIVFDGKKTIGADNNMVESEKLTTNEPRLIGEHIPFEAEEHNADIFQKPKTLVKKIKPEVNN